MQYLRGKPRDKWYRYEKTIDLGNVLWEEYTDYLLNIVEIPEKRRFQNAQAYADARQRVGQSVYAFDSYLSNIEAQMPAYNEAQRRNHFFAKLLPDLRRALTNYQNLPTMREGLVALASRLESNL